ncbi:uncharacterized protein LOC107272586 isoform X15 [Cephus cinctus]|uniref:Uncharacterized protein LOC107272586 isoform X15 n=1 Tax=Cephus cinctus TaxID=211228 RepID=A0AAJ7RR85_CEPCN|nr:uncharacterized protein LOC107272586 isoform X15 [Cephus cinctus]
MADDRTTPQGIVASVHALGHASPPPPAPSSAGTKEGTPPRGPRTLLLRRSENGFGFTLRHFIVYPPESCCMLPGHERTRIDEPMDTIFVKQVRAKSPAAEAGLRTGDRVVSVDGAPTRGEQYASVVQRIQQAGPWLRLLVVSKEDDILQRYFGDTAHNPETNQRPRLRSPERTSQKQRRSSSMIPGPSPRSRQSWVCSTSGSENQVTGTESYKQREDVCKDPKMIVSSQRRPLEAHNQDSATLYEKAERNQQRRQQKDLLNATPQPYRPPPDSRFDLYDRTRPESIYSRPSTEQLYDRIKDPIYERVKPDSSNFGKSLDRYPMSRAEPQVPIYRPGRRIVARRASEGSGIVNDIDISGPFGSADALKQSSNPGSRLSMDSSPASKESLSSYDSNSTLTGNECSDDSVIMTRLRKSFEQKEEFLRRPSHPIGWLSPEESARSTAHVQPLIQREFYARPQKLQRQVWPPSEQQQQQHSATLPRQQSPSRSSMERASKSGGKPSNQNVQRVKTDMDSESEYTGNRSSPNELPPSAEEIQAVRDHFYSSLYDCNGQFVKENHFKYGSSTPQFRPANNAPQRNSTSNKAFVTTLSRIHENVTTGQHNQDQHHQSQQAQDLRNGTASLPSSPGPDKKSGEKFPVPPQGLQIVSRRAKQFESGRLLSDDDEPTSDRTSLYKSELSRLSSKRSVPNVAVRKREFESKAECQEPRRIANHRESKSLDAGDEDRATRRVSYLKATWGERMHVDSDLELSDTEPVHALRSNSIPGTHGLPCSGGNGSDVVTSKDAEPVEREGSLHVKFTVLDGKRSTDRSWKQVWGVLRGPILHFYKDRHSQSPSTTSDGEAGQNVDVRCSLVDIADDYTKRKHVLRVANPTAEVLLQAEDAASMALWLRALHKHAAAEKPTDIEASTSKQQAVPQTPGPTSTSTAAGQPASQRLSPLPSHKGIRKLTSFRNRSPTGQSPANKTRKPSQTVEPIPSPKTKTWKGRVAKQFRKMHGQAGSPSSPTTQLPPEGATFKIPLEMCPPSSFSEFVPLIVEMCTSIVEARGLEVIGIYRVPGNTAAISQLTESVNKGFENINLQDPRWSDVNVISSLLKSFFRQLPDSLLTADLYPMFIDADKIEDPQRRMATIRKLLRDLPEHHFQTLKYLMFHLKRVVEHSEVNKMEAKNLAIVFGPTLVRASGSRDNMVTMVTDMSHQCRIVESLLNNVDWFFSEEDLDDLSRLSVNLSLPADGNEVEPTSNTNHSLLLNNIQKVEGMRDMVSARDIVSSIISAANRKMQRRRKGHDEPDNDEIDEDKSKSKHSDTGSMAAARQSMALNERQCSVSEIVLMHESKSQQSNQQTSGSGDRSDRSDLSISSAGNYVSPSNGSSSRSKYSTSQSSQSVVVAPSSPESSTHLGNEMGSSNLDSISTISNISNDTKQSNDEVAIRSYAGLSATTQERIRRFEQETKAMLQRDQHRQRREAEKREEEKKRIDMEWQLAKREMENDDILDSIADTTVTPSFFSERLSNLNERLADRSHEPTQDRHARSRSTTRIAPISVAVQKKPTAQQKAQASTQLSNILGEKMNNGIIKKFKTDKEPSLESASLSGARYGSLDSLHEVHAHPHASPSPSRQQRGVPGDISDDAGSCFLHWTQKILTINKKLSRHTATPGFWCYISSHLHGAAGASGTSPKAPTPSPPPTATGPSRSGTSSSSSTSQPTEPGPSGSGAVATSKTLNKFLRGSDLLTSLTSTFDRKWKSLVNPNSQLTSSSESATPRVPDAKTDHDETLLVTVDDQPEPRHFADLYRDPSLHRSAVDTNRIVPRLKDNAPEKDTDCTVVEGTGVGLKTDRARTVTVSSSSTPDNDRNVIRQKDAKSTGSATTSFSGTGADRSTFLDATEKDESDGTKRFESLEKDQDDSATVVSCVSTRTDAESREEKRTGDDGKNSPEVESTSYSNKLEKFESLSQGNPESRSRLKRSESLNKRTESAASKLKRSESLNKHSDRLASPTNGKLKRSESLNKHSERSVSPNSKLKRSESLTKTEKTECNISKRRQSVRKESATKLKRKNGMPERSIKRRHTVGGTKDFDKVHWLDNKLQAEAAERVIKNDNKPKKSQLRTSSPDLSSNRVNVADTSFLIEVSFRGPSNVVFNVTNAQPQSLPDDNLASKVFKVPLESHV